MRTHFFATSIVPLFCATLGLAGCAAAPSDAGTEERSDDSEHTESLSQAVGPNRRNAASSASDSTSGDAFDEAVGQFKRSCTQARDELQEIVDITDRLLGRSDQQDSQTNDGGLGSREQRAETSAAGARAAELYDEVARVQALSEAFESFNRCLEAFDAFDEWRPRQRWTTEARGGQRRNGGSRPSRRPTADQEARLDALGYLMFESMDLNARAVGNLVDMQRQAVSSTDGLAR